MNKINKQTNKHTLTYIHINWLISYCFEGLDDILLWWLYWQRICMFSYCTVLRFIANITGIGNSLPENNSSKYKSFFRWSRDALVDLILQSPQLFLGNTRIHFLFLTFTKLYIPNRWFGVLKNNELTVKQ